MYDLSEVKTIFADKAAGSEATVYTVPANTILILTAIHLTNVSGSAATVTLKIGTDILVTKDTETQANYHFTRQLIIAAGGAIKAQSTSGRVGVVLNGVLVKDAAVA